MTNSIIKPKQPKGKGWVSGPKVPEHLLFGFEGYYWFFPDRDLIVMSSVEVAHDENDIDKGPSYHVSVSKRTGRCTSNEAKFVVQAFGMEDSDEDNHVPNGVVRNFWMPVADKFKGHVCPCKDEEPTIKEDKGDYVWRGISKLGE